MSVRIHKAKCPCNREIGANMGTYTKAPILCGYCLKPFQICDLDPIEQSRYARRIERDLAARAIKVKVVDRGADGLYTCIEILEPLDDVRIGGLIRVDHELRRVVSIAKHLKPEHGGIPVRVTIPPEYASGTVQ